MNIRCQSSRFFVPLALLGLSAAALTGAYIAEYGFGLKPCILCLYQRIPYVAVAALGLLGLVLSRKKPVGNWLSILGALMFLAGAGIAFYHVGVEQRWWTMTEKCLEDTTALTVEELRRQIAEATLARCDQPALVVFGLSMAAWNMLYSLGCAAFCLYMLRFAHDKNPKH